jgi:hypothetical protein
VNFLSSHTGFEGKLGPIPQKLWACVEIISLLFTRQNQLPLILASEQLDAWNTINDAPPCGQAERTFQSRKMSVYRASLIVISDSFSSM